ncbi:DUF4136 domain-containing protein [Flavobacterium psychrotrophum]|uniref:DUF4136 domain-containing protein n=1 Tax=Flavobacterium psychrotrophum TaxID=2294119 RepID=UPI000E315B17|nr:DUF4136 domain-containing protein [Flavobacterium psychrotrophum]
MKTIKLLSLFVLTTFAVSCASVNVNTDYDDNTDFTTFKTYGFLKDGVDKAEISDLDKKRIMKALDTELTAKGLTKSDKPDVFINFFTKASKDVNVNNFGGYGGWGYGGWGWGGYGWGGPWGWGGNYTSVSTQTEGTLYIDVIDAKKKELVWQGIGNGVLTQNRDKKTTRINEFVNKIIAQFPPKKDK